MALTVETGELIDGANSYISLDDAISFVSSRGYTSILTDGLLLRAMDVIESLSFLGERVSTAQSLQFPRRGIVCNGAELASDVIPAQLKAAQCWMAHYIAQGKDPSAARDKTVRRERVDALEVEYDTTQGLNNSPNITDLPLVNNAIKCLLSCNNTTCNPVRFISRA